MNDLTRKGILKQFSVSNTLGHLGKKIQPIRLCTVRARAVSVVFIESKSQKRLHFNRNCLRKQHKWTYYCTNIFSEVFLSTSVSDLHKFISVFRQTFFHLCSPPLPPDTFTFARIFTCTWRQLQFLSFCLSHISSIEHEMFSKFIFSVWKSRREREGCCPGLLKKPL